MNSISLRLSSSIKSDKKKIKNYESELIDVEQFQFGQENEEFNEYLKKLKNATTIEDQLSAIKSISKDPNRKAAIDFLVEIYFRSKLKSPIKKSISCSLIQLKADEKLIVESLRQKIESEIKKIDENSLEDSNSLVSILNECFQNFKPAVTAIGETVNLLLPFLKESLCLLNEELKKLSPAQRNETATYAHHNLQLMISCVKNYLLGNQMKFSIQDCLDEIIEETEKTLETQDIPMDTKINCGILIVLKAKIKNETDYVDFILDEETKVAKKLALIIGGISSMETIDFSFLAMVSEILKDIYDGNSIDPSIALVVCRAYVQITKKMSLSLVSQEMLEEQEGNIEDMCKASLSFAFLNFEHFMDSVRHLSKDIIKQLLDFAVKNKWQKIVDEIFQLLGAVDSISLRSNLITTVTAGISVEKLVEKIPDIREYLLKSFDSENLVQNQNIVNCYESLLTKGHSELVFETWFDFWINPMIVELANSEEPEILASLENLVKKSIKKDSKIVSRILRNGGISLSSRFVLLIVGEAKKQGNYDGIQSNKEMWRNIVKFELIQKSMLSKEDSERICAISLLIDSRKTTELFSKEEFDCILHFLVYNINVQSPAIRQKILGLFKNFFLRIHAGIPILKRTRNHLIQTYFEFLLTLRKFSLENLFPGANFTRRTLCLQILFYTLEVLDEFYRDESIGIWEKREIQILINCLGDSYESNKEMAMEVLKLIPKQVLELEDSIELDGIRELVVSVKPTDCLTAAYHLEFLARFKSDQEAFYNLICWLEEILENGLKTAQQSLLRAARTNPLYGAIYCIKHLLEKIDIDKIAQDLKWREFYGRLILNCKKLTDVVAPIVNDDSPEGILPKEEDGEEIGEETTPQMVLLLAWRTVKEVSLILGYVCLRAPLDTVENPGLVKSQQILYVCDHFIELLSKTKHRGAFEQAYVGFGKLCIRLWSENDSELHTIPGEMMKQLMVSIAGKDNSSNELIQLKNLCATRRSAGLPFMILGLITSELKISSTSKGLQYCMQNLIEFCQSDNLESKTHSLNILRALFRSTDLGEPIGEFVADGIKVALIGYSSESWVVRNSSTLLFSALMVRVFGVQRNKDSDKLNIRNKMTARIFFLRYPQLYDFIQEQLEEAAALVVRGLRNPKLHPLLLMLNRLYSSALDGTENNWKLTKFVPLVSICSQCMELQTRYLAAKFIAVVVPPDTILERVYTIYGKIQPNISSNSVHGGLLQVYFMIRSIAQEQFTCSLSKEDWNKVLKISCNLAKDLKGNSILYSTVLEIILEILSQLSFADFDGNFNEIFKDNFEVCDFGKPMAERNIVLLKLTQLKFENSGENFLTNFNLEEISLDFLQAILNVVLIVLDLEYVRIMAEEFDIKERQISYVNNILTDNQLENLRIQLKKSPKLKQNLLKIVERNELYHCTMKAYQILGCLNVEQKIGNVTLIKSLIEEAGDKPDNLQSAIYRYVNAMLTKYENFEEFDFEFLYNAAILGSYLVKLSISDILNTIFTKFSSLKSLDIILNLSRTILLLLMDDEFEIREKNAKIVTSVVSNSMEEMIPIFAQELYLKSLVERLAGSFSNVEIVTLILSLFVDESGCDDEESSIAEFRVFDKNEANIFCEFFSVKRQCLEILKVFVDKENFDVSDNFEQILETAKYSFKNQRYHHLLLKVPGNVLKTFKIEF